MRSKNVELTTLNIALLGRQPKYCEIPFLFELALCSIFLCKTRENSNFMKKDKIVILVKIQIFFRSRITKQTSPLESSREI